MAATDKYREFLERCRGNDFQHQVCALLRRKISDFQTVPAKPSGDGGLDGLSHASTVGYCCYGTEPDIFTARKELAAAIVTKFTDDMRKLCEVEPDGRTGRLVRTSSSSLGDIMQEGARIQVLRLLANWFESHKVVGRLTTEFARCRKASACKFVHEQASVTIWGPHELSTTWTIDEEMLLMMQQVGAADRVREAARTRPIPVSAGFDDKFAWLEAQQIERGSDIRRAANQLRQSWRTALALDQELADTSVAQHKALEEARGAALADAQFLGL